jgi:hypothetical protein
MKMAGRHHEIYLWQPINRQPGKDEKPFCATRFSPLDAAPEEKEASCLAQLPKTALSAAVKWNSMRSKSSGRIQHAEQLIQPGAFG